MSLPKDPRVADLFDAVADLTPEKRIAYLEQQCASDADLRDAVLEFLRKADADRSSSALARALRPSESFSALVEFSDSGVTRRGISLGSQIGKYSIEEKLDEGGMGVVYVAQHSELERRAAVKVMHATQATSQAMVQRFINEARAAARIAHPGIVEIFDVGRHPSGDLYILMEFLVGESLEKRLKNQGAMTENQAISLMLQAARALQAAHDKDIVHRDLKPANIFLVADPEVPGGERVKLLDFGIAKLRETQGELQTKSGMIMGTPPYMSPEQCLGSRSVDLRTDLYALGVILFEMLAGRRPFKKRGHGEYIIAHIHQQPPLVTDFAPDTSAHVARIIDRLLAKDRELRFRSSAELAVALEGDEVAQRRLSSEVPTVDVMPTLADQSGSATVSLQSGDWRIEPLVPLDSQTPESPERESDVTTDLSGRRASAEHIATGGATPARAGALAIDDTGVEERVHTTLSGAAGQAREVLEPLEAVRATSVHRRQLLRGMAALAVATPAVWMWGAQAASTDLDSSETPPDTKKPTTSAGSTRDTNPPTSQPEQAEFDPNPPVPISMILECKQRSLDWLRKDIDEGRLEVKLAVIQAIERGGVQACTPLLWQALGGEPAVRMAAAEAAHSMLLPEAVVRIHRVLEQTSSDMRVRLQLLSLQLGDTDSRALARKAVAQGGDIGLKAALALAMVADKKHAKPLLARVFAETQPGRTRWQLASRGLRQLGQPEATRAIQRELNRKEARRALTAAETLIAVGTADDARLAAVDFLRRMASDPSFPEPGHAALSLARHGDPHAQQFIDRGLLSSDPEQRELALAIIARFPARVQRDARTVVTFTRNEDWRVRIQARVTLQAFAH